MPDPVDSELFIDGAWVGARERERFPNIDPATEREIGSVPIATADDIDHALSAADLSADVWRATPSSKRALHLQHVARALTARRDTIAHILTLEQGKTLQEAFIEVDVSAAIFRWFAELSERLRDQLVTTSDPSVTTVVVEEAVGPVAIFTPWNFPLIEPSAHAAAALAAGCPVIAKVAEETPLTGVALFRAISEGGVPPGVAQLITGEPEFISERLIRSSVIRKVALTGSIPVGRKIATLASRYLKPATLELGGNAPVLVFRDADIPSGSGLHGA
jgi:succinate-semialdehyde dehydrogenase / glutarate-semialdehyde dehydrogenase